MFDRNSLNVELEETLCPFDQIETARQTMRADSGKSNGVRKVSRLRGQYSGERTRTRDNRTVIRTTKKVLGTTTLSMLGK